MKAQDLLNSRLFVRFSVLRIFCEACIHSLAILSFESIQCGAVFFLGQASKMILICIHNLIILLFLSLLVLMTR